MPVTRREGVLILSVASFVYICTSLFQYFPSFNENLRATTFQQVEFASNATLAFKSDLGILTDIPETTLIAHAPGWTLFRNLYMSNGTLFIVSSDPAAAGFPPIRMVTSTGNRAENTPENIASREPTDQEMQIINPHLALQKWSRIDESGAPHRISTIEGNTILVNEPSQFLDHFYHFVAELWLGIWAFVYGAFSPSSQIPIVNSVHARSSFNPLLSGYLPPSFQRIIFMHASSDTWRDKPGFNAYFLRAAFPSLTIEASADWNDRIHSTNSTIQERAWHFPVVLLSDRSAANRGDVCGSQTQRVAAEAWNLMLRKGNIDDKGNWWTPIRENIYRFAGYDQRRHESPDAVSLAHSQEFVITYVNRQGVRRHLIPAHHDLLVDSLSKLVSRKVAEGKRWRLNVVQPELLSKDEQVKVAAETTILLGVHGNGLTHLIFMNPSQYSTVIEMFYPGGFARDYEWTSRALGMRHFSVWNDTHFTHPNEPPLGYPEGFQGTSIPVYGPAVAKLIEDRLEGRLHFSSSSNV